jgi:hypothetical protein
MLSEISMRSGDLLFLDEHKKADPRVRRGGREG